MTLFGEVHSRIQTFLQKPNETTDEAAITVMQIQQVLSQLATYDLFPQLIIIPGVTGQAIYDLPSNTVRMTAVIYNGNALRYATERTLDLSGNTLSWERNTGEPTYFSWDNQNPNRMRLIPAPLRDGSTIPTATFLPFAYPLDDNILIFTYEDVSETVTENEDTLPTLADWDDIVVFETVKGLAMREFPEQNIPVASAAEKLSQLWRTLV